MEDSKEDDVEDEMETMRIDEGDGERRRGKVAMDLWLDEMEEEEDEG